MYTVGVNSAPWPHARSERDTRTPPQHGGMAHWVSAGAVHSGMCVWAAAATHASAASHAGKMPHPPSPHRTMQVTSELRPEQRSQSAMGSATWERYTAALAAARARAASAHCQSRVFAPRRESRIHNIDGPARMLPHAARSICGLKRWHRASPLAPAAPPCGRAVLKSVDQSSTSTHATTAARKSSLPPLKRTRCPSCCTLWRPPHVKQPPWHRRARQRERGGQPHRRRACYRLPRRRERRGTWASRSRPARLPNRPTRPHRI